MFYSKKKQQQGKLSHRNLSDIKKNVRIDVFLTGELMRELTHTALSNVAGILYLNDVSVRGDKIVVCGYDGAAIFKLTH